MMMNILCFCIVGKALSYPFMKGNFDGWYNILGWQFFLLHIKYITPLSSGQRNQPLASLKFLYMQYASFLFLYSRTSRFFLFCFVLFFEYLIINTLIIISLNIVLFGLGLIRTSYLLVSANLYLPNSESHLLSL